MKGQVSAGPRRRGASSPQRPAQGSGRRRWTWLRGLFAVAILGAGVAAAVSRHAELAEAGRALGHVDIERLGVVLGLELASMMPFARLQRLLLRAGGVDLGLWSMVEITFAGNALGTLLPGGAAWSATWAFGQLRRRGADRVLATWVLLVAGAISSFALFLIVVAGAFVAGGHGPLHDLRGVAAALAAIPVVAGGLGLWANRAPGFRAVWRRVVDRVDRSGRLGSVVVGSLSRLWARIRTVQPGALEWTELLGFALANWLLDAGCLVASIWALRAAIPWQGILAAYGLTQIAASFPVTPGGLGVVEASLAALLVAYGMPTVPALAATFLYRAVSFWALQPLGWAAWGSLELAGRVGIRRRSHPWAIHPHAGGTGREAQPLMPTPCEDCEEVAEPEATSRRA